MQHATSAHERQPLPPFHAPQSCVLHTPSRKGAMAGHSDSSIGVWSTFTHVTSRFLMPPPHVREQLPQAPMSHSVREAGGGHSSTNNQTNRRHSSQMMLLSSQRPRTRICPQHSTAQHSAAHNRHSHNIQSAAVVGKVWVQEARGWGGACRVWRTTNTTVVHLRTSFRNSMNRSQLEQ